MAKKPTKKTSAAKSTGNSSGSDSTSFFSRLKPWQQQLLQHGLVILGFYVLVMLMFKPIVFDGQVLNQEDAVNYQGLSHQMKEYRAETGDEPLWNPYLFSGMPGYQAGTRFDSNWFDYITRIFTFGLPRPANYIFVTFLGFYFLLLTLKMNTLMSAIGAVAYAMSSYWFIIHLPGHVSKAAAISFMAFLVAGVIQTYRGKYLLGGALTAFFTALEVDSNHYQISYYVAIAFLLFGLVYFIDAVRSKTLPAFFKASAVVVLAAILGALPNIGRVWTTAEYASVTMRGGSELPAEDASDEGLEEEYAFRWSYGISETFTLMIPDFNGGGSVPFDNQSSQYKKVAEEYTPQITQYAGQFGSYWGEQPITSGPVYVGAIVCFLFILGLILVQGPLKWWLVSVTALSILLAWGSHSFVANLFFDYFPLYNKFRAPSMTLVLAEFSMPFLAILGLREIMTAKKEENMARLKRALFIAAGITGGLSLVFFLLGGTFFDFLSDMDLMRINQARQSGNLTPDQADQILGAMAAYREGLFKMDALRSAALILASGALILLYLRGTIKPILVCGGILALVLIDMVPVNTRYLDLDKKDALVSEDKFDANFTETQADKFIHQDKDPGFRVLNLGASLAYDKFTPYHHRSVGGYHAAKMRRYQDVIDSVLFGETRMIISHLQSGQVTDSSMQAVMSRTNGLNMLNTRYVIYNPQAPALQNLSALGNAWFVNNLQQVSSPQEEIMALRRINPATTAVVDASYDGGRFGEILNVSPAADPNASIELTEFSPNVLRYVANRQGEGIAVFSEIYYNDTKGWNAYINGEKVPHARVNYVLRALKVPSGRSEIEFRFEPSAYSISSTIAMISSILVVLLLGFAVYGEWRSGRGDS